MQIAGSSRPEGLSWKISSYCNGGDCVRVAQTGSSIFLGDSKNPNGATLSYARSAWEHIINNIKSGNYDQFR